MIPILYESTETSFTSNGIGRLSDAVSCTVTEERNGPYELEMDYPVTGIHYEEIQLFRLIYATPADGKAGQPFEIYSISKPLDGVVTIRAWHISYRLNRIVVKPFTAASCSAALTGLKTNSLTTNSFTFSTDKNVAATFTVKQPEPLRGLLGGQEGSILDVYGTGEYEWDKFRVNLWTNRGADNGVRIRYGKNLTDLTADADMETVYTGIVPYYYNDSSNILVLATQPVVWSSHRTDYSVDMVKPVDFSSRFGENAPTPAQLLTAAQSYVESNKGWELNDNLKVSFVALADTEEYKSVAALQRVNLCDTVTILHEGLGVSAIAKVIKTEYDVLLERYNEIELGTASVSLGQAISESILEEVPTTSEMQQAIANGTALITGNSGGYVVLKSNANGQPEELLIMDNPDIDQASNVWRFNSSGLGFSSNGYDGPYSTAWTLDGTFYANWITAGTMSANRVRTGTLTSYDGKVSIVLGDANTSGKLIIDATNFTIDSSGNVTITGQVNANTGRIGGYTIDSNSIYTGTKGSGIPDGGTAPASGAITLSSANFTRLINGTSRSGLRFAIGQYFGVHANGTLYAGNANIAGAITANSGRIGGSSGLTIKTGAFYSGSKSTLMSGKPGIYVGTDGVSIGNNGNYRPALWCDYDDELVRVARLDFVTTPDSSPYWGDGHALLLDDKKRIFSGAGCNFGSNGAYNPPGGEYDSCIYNTLYYGSQQQMSDRRIKHDIEELETEDSKAFIMGLRPVSYQFGNDIEQEQRVHHGMIAQEVQEVVRDKWGVVGGSAEMLCLNYTEMIADLIKVVQDQEKRITELEEKLKEKE